MDIWGVIHEMDRSVMIGGVQELERLCDVEQ